MELQFSIEVNATKGRIWQYYTDTNLRSIWEGKLENLEFDGEFVTGTTGRMKLAGMPEISFTLVNIVPHAVYWDRTDLPNGTSLYFKHDIIDENGIITLRHSVSIEKESVTEEDLSFLQNVFSDVPRSVMKIKMEAEK